MRNVIVSLALSAALAVSLTATRGQAAAPLSVRLSSPQGAGPGRVRVDATIAGLDPDLHPTIQQSIVLGLRTRQGKPFPVIGPRMPYVVDLPAGAVRVGGVVVDEFAPLPPLEDNTSISFAVTVRQGGEVATATVTDLLLLPTVIVPGYLNDFWGGKVDVGAVTALEARGFRTTGPSPTLFWFGYPSRTLSLNAAAQELAAYVRTTVLPATYATRINLVTFSLGGLVARWNMASQPGWDRLVNRFVMIAVPNEGSVLSYVDGWYPLGGLARTPAARTLLPTFPFWRSNLSAEWTIPPGSANTVLNELNTHPLPASVRAYVFYGDFPQRGAAPGTLVGVTGALPQADVSYGPGDGIVLAASALGLPINGSPGVPGLAERLALKVDLGPTHHQSLFAASGPRVADALLDRRIGDTTDTIGAHKVQSRIPPAIDAPQDGPDGGFLEPAFQEGNP